MKAEVKKLIQSIIYILMGLQVLLGGLWICSSLGGVSRFEESTELLAMSKTLCIDEYTGILYPLCIRAFITLGEWVKLSGCAFVYVLQLVVACLAYQYFLKRVVGCSGKKGWFFALFIVTIPTIAQCHVAVLPYSLVSSVFVLLLTELVELWRDEAKLRLKQMLRIGIWWVVSALICPDYSWLSGIAVVISALRYLLLHKKTAWQLLALCLAGVLCIGTIEALVQKDGAMGKIQRFVGSAMVLRCVWPNFGTFQYFWGEEVTALWNSRELANLAMYPEKVIYEFGPVLEQTYGKERAEEIYLEMSKTAISLDTKNIVLNMAREGAAYVCPPLTMLLQLKGVGVSYTGWNYGRMKDYAPELTGYYVNYALYTWVCVFGLSVVLWWLNRNTGQEGRVCKQKMWTGGFIGTVSLVINLWYVMCSGNMQDYKKVIVNSVLCAFLVIWLMRDPH